PNSVNNNSMKFADGCSGSSHTSRPHGCWNKLPFSWTHGIVVMADIVDSREILARIRVERAKQEPPRPLMREMPPADPFPVDALGELCLAARAIHDRVQAPMAICAQSVLGTAGLVTQAYANVELPIGGKRVKPISSYLITIAESGERKTEADFQASWAIR